MCTCKESINGGHAWVTAMKYRRDKCGKWACLGGGTEIGALQTFYRFQAYQKAYFKISKGLMAGLDIPSKLLGLIIRSPNKSLSHADIRSLRGTSKAPFPNVSSCTEKLTYSSSIRGHPSTGIPRWPRVADFGSLREIICENDTFLMATVPTTELMKLQLLKTASVNVPSRHAVAAALASSLTSLTSLRILFIERDHLHRESINIDPLRHMLGLTSLEISGPCPLLRFHCPTWLGKFTLDSNNNIMG